MTGEWLSCLQTWPLWTGLCPCNNRERQTDRQTERERVCMCVCLSVCLLSLAHYSTTRNISTFFHGRQFPYKSEVSTVGLCASMCTCVHAHVLYSLSRGSFGRMQWTTSFFTPSTMLCSFLFYENAGRFAFFVWVVRLVV